MKIWLIRNLQEGQKNNSSHLSLFLIKKSCYNKSQPSVAKKAALQVKLVIGMEITIK